MWDLSHIFESREAFEKAYADAAAKVGDIASLRGHMTSDAEVLKTSLDKIYKLGENVEKVYLYAYLHKESDNSDPEYQNLAGRATNLLVDFSSAVSFMNPEILSVGSERLGELIEDEKLASYKHILEDIARGAEHTLDEKSEKMLAMLSDVSETPSDAFGMLESVDMTFPDVTDEDGNAVALTHGNFSVYMTSPDRDVRREAYEKYFGEFEKYINTFAALYSGNVKFDTFFANARSFDGALSASLFSSNVPTDVYDSLICAVHDALPAMDRYIDLRRRTLGLDKVEMYDLYCPIVGGVRDSYTFEEALELVFAACAPLGDEYVALLHRAADEKWIDVYENAGKTTGAFSCGVYGVHPYVLLNYTGTLDDVFTLAHELGHAMHSHYSSTEQDFANHNYTIFAAEVASTVNEVLLTKYLLRTESDPQRRAYVLNHFTEGFRTTVFRQTLFAEFEKNAHDAHADGTPLTAESLNAMYRELNLKYYSSANVGELHSIEWARIPHFYRAYYVYQYATGFCSAVAIAQGILDTGCADGYLAFLKTGASDYPIEELKLAGIDLTTPEPVKRALKVFSDTVDELAKSI